ncbi:hypothetical protein [Marinoscillum furvescens]|uniref:Uncharacterized protein n=1 Tax=Marinoscillum furvescens DSM 4134 TaxID=1122208 RepID=A0A3D9L562_MARFU|nr:hypothetical protein [Marinoscillum furvescens]REE01132.1 hypothetical protein C7460_104152 [Marinoscillum furvescens DSM 4134]
MRNLLFILLVSLCDVQADLDVSNALVAVGPDKVLAISTDPTVQHFHQHATLSSLEGAISSVSFQVSGHHSPGDFEGVDLQKGARAPPSTFRPDAKKPLRGYQLSAFRSVTRKPRDGLIPSGLLPLSS